MVLLLMEGSRGDLVAAVERAGRNRIPAVERTSRDLVSTMENSRRDSIQRKVFCLALLAHTRLLSPLERWPDAGRPSEGFV